MAVVQVGEYHEMYDSVELITWIAKRLYREIHRQGMERKPAPPSVNLPPKDLIRNYDSLVINKTLRNATRKLFTDGHYARSVEEAYKCLNNTIKIKSSLNKDGQDLMYQAFSEKNPVLKLNRLRTESDRNEQLGYMLIFAGSMTGIRNPRAHEHELWDSPKVALEMLIMANHLMRIVDKTKRSRKRRESSAH